MNTFSRHIAERESSSLPRWQNRHFVTNYFPQNPDKYKYRQLYSENCCNERKKDVSYFFLCHRIQTWSRSSRQHMNISKMSTDTAKVNISKIFEIKMLKCRKDEYFENVWRHSKCWGFFVGQIIKDSSSSWSLSSSSVSITILNILILIRILDFQKTFFPLVICCYWFWFWLSS